MIVNLAAMASHRASDPSSMREALSVPSGSVNLAGFDTAAQPLVPEDKKGRPKKLRTDADRLADLQERLFAEAAEGGRRSVLLVLQGIDTAGKGGVVGHVVGAFHPFGVEYTGFKKPTAEEAAHHFLWRIRKRVPRPGVIGVFDRSHYEDVVVPLVHNGIDAAEVTRRYEEINAFEAALTEAGTTLVKCFLHISYDVQRERLLARLDEPDKRWKFNEGDLAARARWDDYQAAFAAMIENCNTDAAPWYIVPSDSKKYRNWAIGQLLQEVLEDMDLRYPDPPLDMAGLRARLQPPN